MAILVTGGSGVLGLHVTQVLAGRGETVVSYSTSGAPPAAEAVLGDSIESVHYVQGDIRDTNSLRQVVQQYDVRGIIHTVALTGEAQARARTHEVFAVNVTGTLNVLEIARIGKMRRLVYIGSASEYGARPDMQLIQENEVNVEGMYAETKFLGHRLTERYRAVHGLDVVTVRVSSVYGPNTRFNAVRGLVGNTLIAHLCRAVAFDEAVALDDIGDCPRDWTYAADAASGVCLAYDADRPKHAVFNIGSGRSYTVTEVVATIRRIAPAADIRYDSTKNNTDPFQAMNLRGAIDICRARADLGYEPLYDLEAGLRKYIAWWKRVGRGVAINS